MRSDPATEHSSTAHQQEPQFMLAVISSVNNINVSYSLLYRCNTDKKYDDSLN